MKNNKKNILIVAVCGVIISSIGVSIIINNKNESSKSEVQNVLENLEIEDKTDKVEASEVDIKNEMENNKDANDENASKEELVESNSSDKESTNSTMSNSGSSNESSQNTNVNNIPSNNTPVEDVKDEVSSNGNSNSSTNDVVESASKYKDGTYLGEGSGFAGTLQVNVEISNDVITSVVVASHNDTAGISDMAIEQIPSKIMSNQSTSVDVVSGATYTSRGIINAVINALSTALRK